MSDPDTPKPSALPRRRTRDPVVTVTFVEGAEGEQLLLALARGLARRAARQLLLSAQEQLPEGDQLVERDG